MMGLEPKELMIIAALIAVVGIVLSATFGGAFVFFGGSDQVSSERWQYECSGEIDVQVLGKETIKTNSCLRKTCSLFSRMGILDFGTEVEGKVAVSIGGEIVGSQDWESTFGRNQDYTVKTSCENAGEVKVLLYNEAGQQIDFKEGGI